MRFRFLIVFVVSFLALQSVSPAKSQQARPNQVANWGAMFQSQVKRCWKKYDSGSGIEIPNADVAFEIKLKRDGTLEGPLVPTSAPGTADLRTYQDNAARAIVECQPYQLPAEFYNEWKYFEAVFKLKTFASS